MGDIFDSALGLEETHYQEGFDEGNKAGQLVGRQDGKALGIQKGFEVGHEIGYYTGCVQIWRQLGDRNKSFISARAEKAINALEDLVRSFPLGSPRDEGLQEKMDAIRGRYKTALALLGLSDGLSLEPQHLQRQRPSRDSSRLQQGLEF
ncbi:hypothetical protein Ndes2526B_g05177 [Nannochloris sp. 'desiccata']|nr:hypothetical protein KSW81_000103 [Chlorella desiccata (nom. nud.)]KAH7619933.1 putative Protein LTO1-like protein [Chlorella desiccata (nom. nud.)]